MEGEFVVQVQTGTETPEEKTLRTLKNLRTFIDGIPLQRIEVLKVAVDCANLVDALMIQIQSQIPKKEAPPVETPKAEEAKPAEAAQSA